MEILSTNPVCVFNKYTINGLFIFMVVCILVWVSLKIAAHFIYKNNPSNQFAVKIKKTDSLFVFVFLMLIMIVSSSFMSKSSFFTNVEHVVYSVEFKDDISILEISKKFEILKDYGNGKYDVVYRNANVK